MSFCSQFRTLSKLIIVAMEIRGRHRGLPYALDRAILLPSERLHRVETEDLTRRTHQQQQHTQTQPESEPPQPPGGGTPDGLPTSTPFRRRRRRSSVTTGTNVGAAGTGDTAAAATVAVKPKGRGLVGFLQGALSAGPVWASAWKGL